MEMRNRFEVETDLQIVAKSVTCSRKRKNHRGQNPNPKTSSNAAPRKLTRSSWLDEARVRIASIAKVADIASDVKHARNPISVRAACFILTA